MSPLAQHVDVATAHPWAFAFMVILMLIFGVGRVSKESKISVKKWASFVHLWMIAYLVLLGALMSVTTAMALVFLVNEKTGEPTVTFIPPSFVSIAAALAGVFGFEFLFRKLVVGFGETQFDLSGTLQNLVDQAVAATLKREAGG